MTTEINMVYKVLVTDLQNYQEIHSKLNWQYSYDSGNKLK